VRLHYYPETDGLYIELKPGLGVEMREVADGLNVDLSSAGEVVGFDVDHASQRLDLSTIETIALPLKSTRSTGSLNRRPWLFAGRWGREAVEVSVGTRERIMQELLGFS
jgi:uncharacterized protein YuzE